MIGDCWRANLLKYNISIRIFYNFFNISCDTPELPLNEEEKRGKTLFNSSNRAG